MAAAASPGKPDVHGTPRNDTGRPCLLTAVNCVTPDTTMAHAGGKIILLGEHAVVYGVPALAAGIDLGVHASASAAPWHASPTAGAAARLQACRLSVTPWDVTVSASAPTPDAKGAEAGLARALSALLTTYAAPLERYGPAWVHAEVQLPAGAGLGCSAALGVAVVRALDAHWKVARSALDQAELSLAWERVFHGNPSGVDNVMAACGGVACFQRGAPLRQIDLPRPLRLVVAHSGEKASTEVMVQQVAALRQAARPQVDAALANIHSLVQGAERALMRRDMHALGEAMCANQAQLCALKVSTPRLDALCQTAMQAGALGSKLTGSGGGGAMIALVSGAACEAAVCAALQAAGAEPFAVDIQSRPPEAAHATRPRGAALRHAAAMEAP
ncbi:MAG: mevalonate kinase [Polyangiales bacterium]